MNIIHLWVTFNSGILIFSEDVPDHGQKPPTGNGGPKPSGLLASQYQ